MINKESIRKEGISVKMKMMKRSTPARRKKKI